MDAWDADFDEPTEDDRTARRVLALAIGMVNTCRPLSTTEIRREYYPKDMSDLTFRKAFQRDRKHLAMAGIVLRSKRINKELVTWKVDADASFVKEGIVTAEDALALDMLLTPLASDPSFPYAHDLRLALTKIDRAFDGSSQAAIPPEARKRNNNLTRLEDCLTARHAAHISYERVDGSIVDRNVAPLGFFFFRGSTYMVAMRPDASDTSPHTYRIDRVHSVRELRNSHYEIPPDFDVRDFIMLPFQMGDAIYTATFQQREGSPFHEWVCDEDIAASWCIAEDVTPLAPESLVVEWRNRLHRMAGGSDAEA